MYNICAYSEGMVEMSELIGLVIGALALGLAAAGMKRQKQLVKVPVRARQRGR